MRLPTRDIYIFAVTDGNKREREQRDNAVPLQQQERERYSLLLTMTKEREWKESAVPLRQQERDICYC